MPPAPPADPQVRARTDQTRGEEASGPAKCHERGPTADPLSRARAEGTQGEEQPNRTESTVYPLGAVDRKDGRHVAMREDAKGKGRAWRSR